MRKSLIKNNKVIDIIELKDGDNWQPPEGVTIGLDGGEIDDTFDTVNNVYIKPEIPAVPDSEKAQQELNALDNKLSRASEDIIDVLISKNIATLSDFGFAVKDNYNAKKAARVRKNK